MGSYTEEIVGYSTTTVTISILKGKEKIQLKKAVYILNFYINLICL